MLLLASAGAGVFAQTPDQTLMDELVRKAEARESADGFCARTGWPNGDSVEYHAAYLRSAAVGASQAKIFSSGACVLNRTYDVHQENGGKCVGYTYYTCGKSGACGLGRSIDCLDKNGRFISRRDD